MRLLRYQHLICIKNFTRKIIYTVYEVSFLANQRQIQVVMLILVLKIPLLLFEKIHFCHRIAVGYETLFHVYLHVV